MPKLNQKGVIHFLLPLILLAGIIGGVYLVTSGNPLKFFSRAFNQTDSVEQLTEKLLELNTQAGRSAQADNTGQMIALASKRQEKLLEQAEKDPELFLKSARLVGQKESFPPQVQPFIEERKTEIGKLQAFYIDTEDISSSKEEYILTTQTQEYLKVHFKDEINSPLLGEDNRLEGIRLGNDLVLETSNIFSASRHAQAAADATITKGQTKVAVVLINFSNDQSKPFSKEQIADVITGNRPDSVKQFFKDNSYQQLDLTAEYFDWITLPLNNEGCLTESKYVQWKNQAVSEIEKRGISKASFNHWVMVAPPIPSCKGINGVGEVNANPGMSLIVGRQLVPMVYEHEIGHNLGLRHGNLLHCGSEPIKNSSDCISLDSADISSVMGGPSGYNPHFNAPQKLALGWMKQSNTQTVNTNGQYVIAAPVETNADSSQILRIPKNNTNEFYYLSYRQLAPNSLWPPSFANGVSIHIWNDNRLYQTQLVNTYAKSLPVDRLLAQAPPTTNIFRHLADNLRFALEDGQTFIDSNNGIQIKQTSHNQSSVSLQIQLNNPVSTTKKAIAYQVLLSKDGQTTYSRQCQIPNSQNQSVDWRSCTDWVANSINEFLNVTGAKFSSVDSYVISHQGEDFVYLVFLGEDGKSGYSVKCRAEKDFSSALKWPACNEKTAVDFSSIRGVGNEKYIAVASYLITKDGQPFYIQSLVEESGQAGFARTCSVNNDSVAWDRCGSWSRVDFTNLRNLGNEKYLSVTNFFLKKPDGGVLQQSLLDFNGSDGYFRVCPVDKSRVNWEECNSWSLVPLGSLRGGQGEQYLSITTYIVDQK